MAIITAGRLHVIYMHGSYINTRGKFQTSRVRADNINLKKTGHTVQFNSSAHKSSYLAHIEVLRVTIPVT